MATRKQFITDFIVKGAVANSFRNSFSTTNKTIFKTNKNTQSLNKTFSALGLSMPVATAGAFIVAMDKMSDKAVDFEKNLDTVGTLLTGNVDKKLQGLGKNIQKLQVIYGKSAEVLTNGSFEIVSAFGEQEIASDKLRLSTEAAVAGNTDIVSSVKLASSVTKAYGDTSDKAVSKVFDLAFQTNKLGQTTFPELAASMGKVVPKAAALGQSQEELFGVFATLTGVTGDAAAVSTQLNAVYTAFLKPNEKLIKATKALGFENASAMLKSKGLEETLKILKGTVDGDSVALTEMFGRAEAITGVLALTGGQADNFAEKSDAMTKAIGSSSEAFKVASGNTDNLKKRNKELGNVIATNIGGKALPVINDFLETSIKVGTFVTENWAKIEPVVVGLGSAFLTYNVIAGTSALLTTAFGGAVLLTEIPLVIATIATTAWGAALAFATSPIFLVSLAIGALIGFLVLLEKKFGLVTKVMEAFKKSTKTEGKFIADSKMLGGEINNTRLTNNVVPNAKFATGVTNFSGGLALVGEGGPEVVSLGTGSNVITNENTQKLLSGNSGSSKFNITFSPVIHSSNPQEIVSIMDEEMAKFEAMLDRVLRKKERLNFA